jgi:hypothetical protein
MRSTKPKYIWEFFQIQSLKKFRNFGWIDLLFMFQVICLGAGGNIKLEGLTYLRYDGNINFRY